MSSKIKGPVRAIRVTRDVSMGSTPTRESNPLTDLGMYFGQFYLLIGTTYV